MQLTLNSVMRSLNCSCCHWKAVVMRDVIFYPQSGCVLTQDSSRLVQEDMSPIEGSDFDTGPWGLFSADTINGILYAT